MQQDLKISIKRTLYNLVNQLGFKTNLKYLPTISIRKEVTSKKLTRQNENKLGTDLTHTQTRQTSTTKTHSQSE